MSSASKRHTVAVAVGVTLAAIAFERFVHLTPAGWPSVLLWSSVAIALSVAGLLLVHRLRPQAILSELGLTAPLLPAVALVSVASVAPIAVLLLAGGVPVIPDAGYLFSLAVLGPVGEEVLFRGFLFKQLQRRAAWGFWPSAILSSFLFGLAHVHGIAQTLAAPMAVVVPAIGGVFFAWLFARWRDNLWVPLAVHSAMNFWWEMLHSIGDPAASQHAELARGVFIVLAVFKTLRETKFDGEV